jgi:hypothetical protein
MTRSQFSYDHRWLLSGLSVVVGVGFLLLAQVRWHDVFYGLAVACLAFIPLAVFKLADDYSPDGHVSSSGPPASTPDRRTEA